jgi:uncharacterized phosphosugar-binding protein
MISQAPPAIFHFVPMPPLAATYFATATGLLKHAYETNRPLLMQLGPLIGRSVAAGGVIHAFGSGHSEIIARAIVGRAGGLACVRAIYDTTSGFVENLVSYGGKLAEHHDRLYGLRSGETIIVISNSGKSASAIEVARYVRQKGLTVVGLKSAAMACPAQTNHPAGENLPTIADVADDVRAGPTSTLAGAMLLNLLFLEVVEWL